MKSVFLHFEVAASYTNFIQLLIIGSRNKLSFNSKPQSLLNFCYYQNTNKKSNVQGHLSTSATFWETDGSPKITRKKSAIEFSVGYT